MKCNYARENIFARHFTIYANKENMIWLFRCSYRLCTWCIEWIYTMLCRYNIHSSRCQYERHMIHRSVPRLRYALLLLNNSEELRTDWSYSEWQENDALKDRWRDIERMNYRENRMHRWNHGWWYSLVEQGKIFDLVPLKLDSLKSMNKSDGSNTLNIYQFYPYILYILFSLLLFNWSTYWFCTYHINTRIL